MRLKVQRFDPTKQLKKHRIILLVGRRGTGKTKLAEDLMYHLRDGLDFGLAMTPTEETAGMFRSHMPASWVYSGFSIDKLEQMLAMQRANVANGKQRDLFLLCDDCTYEKNAWKSTPVRDLFLNGRHARIMLMMSSQYIMDLGPDLRNNIDYVFCLKQPIISEKRKLWTYFFGMVESFSDFSRILDRCCENYGCLVLDNTAPTIRMEDCIFWYRSSLQLPAFRLGKDVFHRLAQKHERSSGAQRRAPSVVVERDKRITTAECDKRITTIERTDHRGRTIKEDKDEVVIA